MRTQGNALIFDTEQERIALSAVVWNRILQIEKKAPIPGLIQEFAFLNNLFEQLKQIQTL